MMSVNGEKSIVGDAITIMPDTVHLRRCRRPANMPVLIFIAAGG